jgi:cobalt/nickel transport system permease protein
VHISDGVLPAQVWVASAAAAGGLTGALLWRLDADRIPRVALCTSFFFVASLVHVPIGPTSAHLLLIGLVGIVMGPLAFLPVVFGLALQALLFGHGGITSLGVNALTMGLPAYAAYGLFRLRGRVRFHGATFLLGLLAGWGAVILSLLFLKAFLTAADEAFAGVAWTVVIAHQPLALIEGLVTGSAAVFLERVEPRVLEGAHV